MGTTPSKAPVQLEVPALNAVGGSEDVGSRMSDEFDSLNATEKAAAEVALIRSRTLAAKIANQLRNKSPEHFDKSSLAELYASLEYAARLLEQKRQ
jgi:hypothetical protein